MQEERMRGVLVGVLGCLVASSPAIAAGGASGTFSLDGLTFKAGDGFAYERKAEFGDEMAVRVRLSEKPLDKKALESVIDFKGELDRQRDQGGSGTYVDLEFRKDGSYSGASYSLGGRSNCGWCSDSQAGARSKLKLEAGSLRGSMQIQPADYRDGKGPAISLTLDLPVATVSGASPLAPSGGEPAKALEACRQAVKRKEMAAVKAGCFLAGDAQLAETENVTEEGFWMVALYGRDSLKLDTLKVTGGRTKGDWAELSVEGSAEGGKRSGSVFLRRGPAGWRFDHESLGYD
jgi:hypothetical protein